MNPHDHAEATVLALCQPLLAVAVDRYRIEGLEREDLEQEAGLALLLAIRSWPGEMPFLGYARNKVRQRLTQLVREANRRKENTPREEGRSPDPVEPIDPAPGPDVQAEAKEELERIRPLLEPREFEVVSLIYWHGASQREAADYMEISIRTLQSYQFRALQKLRSTFGASPAD